MNNIKYRSEIPKIAFDPPEVDRDEYRRILNLRRKSGELARKLSDAEYNIGRSDAAEHCGSGAGIHDTNNATAISVVNDYILAPYGVQLRVRYEGDNIKEDDDLHDVSIWDEGYESKLPLDFQGSVYLDFCERCRSHDLNRSVGPRLSEGFVESTCYDIDWWLGYAESLFMPKEEPLDLPALKVFMTYLRREVEDVIWKFRVLTSDEVPSQERELSYILKDPVQDDKGEWHFQLDKSYKPDPDSKFSVPEQYRRSIMCISEDTPENQAEYDRVWGEHGLIELFSYAHTICRLVDGMTLRVEEKIPPGSKPMGMHVEDACKEVFKLFHPSVHRGIKKHFEEQGEETEFLDLVRDFSRHGVIQEYADLYYNKTHLTPMPREWEEKHPPNTSSH